MKIRALFLILLFSSLTIGQQYKDINEETKRFLDTLQYKSFLYFINEINPGNGLVKDRSAEWSPASIASTGFGVPVWITGVENGWISRDSAANMTLRLVRFLINSDQRGDTNSTGFKGFYYHFLKMDSGEREWNSELSSIDTGLLLAGLRAARVFFDRNDIKEKIIRDLIDKLMKRIDWDWFTQTKSSEDKFIGAISLGWDPKEGFHNMSWVGYNEALILYIIAAGSGYANYGTAYKKWLENYEWIEPYEGLAHVGCPPLFTHQYSQVFVDFRGIYDDYMKEKKIDYFENSRRAALTQRRYSIENPKGWVGYDSLIWGITACDGPGDSFNKDGKTFLYYAGRGTSGPKLTFFDDGTIAPTAAASSIVFAPEVVIPTLLYMKEKYGNDGLWDKYGFVDAFNPTLNWFNKDYIGIDQAPIVLMIQNYKNELIWNLLKKDPVIIEGLKKLNFQN